MHFLVVTLIASFVEFFFGIVWHGPVFGGMWFGLRGISQAELEKMQKEMNILWVMAQSFIQTFVLNLVFGYYVKKVSASFDLILLGAGVFLLGHLHTTTMEVIFMKRNPKLVLLDFAFYVCLITIVSSFYTHLL